MIIRERLEALERQTLHSSAARSSDSKGRKTSEDGDPVRPAYQLDRDRILHSKAFRRLAGKTQVFLRPEGDHYRTRITHTLEVAQIARTIARALGLNEVLTEAIALGHDLGHTPFGHAGEDVLAELMSGGFHHARQSVRVVEVLERDGRGLNLTEEVRDGILKHSKGRGSIFSDSPAVLAMTLEGQVVRVSDIVAYVNHDLDDAVRGRVLQESDVPEGIAKVLGRTHSRRIARMVDDVIGASTLLELRRIGMGDECCDALYALRDFLYERVYENTEIRGEFLRAQRMMRDLWEHCVGNEGWFRERHWPRGLPQEEPLQRAVADFIAGMTDRYALRLFEELRMPRPWSVV